MSTNHTEEVQIARRYVSAIFALAVGAKKEAVVVAEFAALALAMKDHEALAEALASPLVTNAAKAETLTALAKGANAITTKALETLAIAGRAALIPTIAAQLREALAEQQGELDAVVTSARALPPTTQKQLEKSLATATGKKVNLQLKEDESVLGGLLIELGSLRLDATLSGALGTMRQQLLATTN